MFASKLSRLLCLLLCFSLCLVSFGSVNVHAASEENLISHNFNDWTILPEYKDSTVVYGNSGINDIQAFRTKVVAEANGTNVSVGGIYDISSQYNVGDEYVLSFEFISSDRFIGGSIGTIGSDKAFTDFSSTLMVGVGSYNNNSIDVDESYSIIINNSNYYDYVNGTVTFSFTMPSGLVNPCVAIAFVCYSESGSQDNNVYLTFRNFSLINKSAEKEDTLIGKFLDGIKGLFVPDEAFINSWKKDIEELLEERLGIIWQAGDFLVTLITTIINLVVNAPEEISLVLPSIDIDVAGMNIHLWDEQKVDFSFLETNGFFSWFYSLYKVMLNVSFGIPLLNYARKELDNTLHN